MATQLTAFVKAGNKIEVKGRRFTLDGTATEDDITVATFKTARGSYSGVLCVNTTVASKPGAEIWSIIGNSRAIAEFAIHEGKLFPLG
ncbi:MULTISPECIES: hypothetical protein [Stenotrophomonas]|uniref:hypothetical protein n=1 Tax=Stenotrophomonas maltophilia group TaxID=995085 RepID=UPI0021C5A8A4|nr:MULTISPECIES: hypothetical protein [Stenotrophomonas]MCU1136814.1 hypothetical protein [Stenotrophomonas maltophilia]MEC4339859.1 hypothetical protein [Stenotrophomonas pavanii]